MAKTGSEKWSDFKIRRNKIGIVRKAYWATDEQHQAIKDYLKDRADKAPRLEKNRDYLTVNEPFSFSENGDIETKDGKRHPDESEIKSFFCLR